MTLRHAYVVLAAMMPARVMSFFDDHRMRCSAAARVLTDRRTCRRARAGAQHGTPAAAGVVAQHGPSRPADGATSRGVAALIEAQRAARYVLVLSSSSGTTEFAR